MLRHPDAYRPEYGWLEEHPAPYYAGTDHFYVSVLWFLPNGVIKLRHYEKFDDAVLAYRKEKKRKAKADRPTRGKLMLYLTEKGEAHYEGRDRPSCIGKATDL